MRFSEAIQHTDKYNIDGFQEEIGAVPLIPAEEVLTFTMLLMDQVLQKNKRGASKSHIYRPRSKHIIES